MNNKDLIKLFLPVTNKNSLITIYSKLDSDLKSDKNIAKMFINNFIGGKEEYHSSGDGIFLNIANLYKYFPEKLKQDTNICIECLKNSELEIFSNGQPYDTEYYIEDICAKFPKEVIQQFCENKELKEKLLDIAFENFGEDYGIEDEKSLVMNFIKYMNPEYKKDTEFIASLILHEPLNFEDISKSLDLPKKTIEDLKEMPEIQNMIETSKELPQKEIKQKRVDVIFELLE